MINARHLRRLFQGLLAASLTPGCGSDGIDPSEFSSNVCPARDADPFKGLTPATPVDYMELRSIQSIPEQTVVTAKQGSLCATATSSACMDTFALTSPTTGWRTGFSGDGLQSSACIVFTRGDTVDSITSAEALKAFLAPIENEYEAAFMATASLPDHRMRCEGNNARPADGGFELLTGSGSTCGASEHYDEHIVHVASNGDVTIRETVLVEEGDPNCIVGRRPDGLALCEASPAEDRVGAFFAGAARLEAASIHAFERLESELRAYGAPRTLARDARRARDDEARHARVTRRLARRNGAKPLYPRVRPVPERSFLDFVKENAVEGCVRETFGALYATYQSRHATDAEIARAMSVIAIDETRHASLSWRVAKWAEERLSAEERASVASLQRLAMRSLARAIAAQDHDAAEPRAGLPSRAESLRLLDGLSKALGIA